MASNMNSFRSKKIPPPRGTSSFGGAVAAPPSGGVHTAKSTKPPIMGRLARKQREHLDVTRPTVSSRSKYTEKKPVDPDTLRSRSFNLSTNATQQMKTLPKKAFSAASAATAPTRFPVKSPPTATRTPDPKIGASSGPSQANVVKRPNTWLEKRSLKKPEPEAPKQLMVEKLDLRNAAEVSIQTDEAEILDNELLAGKAQFMMPSAVLVAQIDRKRQEALKQTLLKTQRTFEEDAAGQEQHLNDLKEFLEKATITRPRPTQKIRVKNLEKDRKLMKAMDETLKRAVPKTESVTNIKNRIKQKQDEVIKMLENVEQIAGAKKNQQ